jgi:uncharacterized membrane protein (UPF0127 family)
VVVVVVVEAAVAAASSASAEACPRLDGLPARDLADGLRVAEANTRAARMKGLAKLDVLPERLALHIPRCRSVHTFTMRFPLDLIWLGKDGQVVRVDPAVPPRRLKFCAKARSVVEANAGTADRFVTAGL